MCLKSAALNKAAPLTSEFVAWFVTWSGLRAAKSEAGRLAPAIRQYPMCRSSPDLAMLRTVSLATAYPTQARTAISLQVAPPRSAVRSSAAAASTRRTSPRGRPPAEATGVRILEGGRRDAFFISAKCIRAALISRFVRGPPVQQRTPSRPPAPASRGMQAPATRRWASS